MALASPSFPDPSALDAVIWDYDGTLVATRGADEQAVERLLVLDPAAISGVEIFWAHEGRPIEERVEMAWPGRTAEILPLFEANVVPDIFDGIVETLTDLRGAGFRMGVVSSRRRVPLRWGLQACGLMRYFQSVIGLDDVSEPKPEPEGILRTLGRLRSGPGRALYVGDSAVDVLAARAAGIRAYRAAWAEKPAPGDPPAVVLGHPSELLGFLEGPFRAQSLG